MDKKTPKRKSNKLPVKQLQHAILNLLKENPALPLDPHQIAQKLGIENNKDSVQHAIDTLVQSGKIGTPSNGEAPQKKSRKPAEKAARGRRSDSPSKSSSGRSVAEGRMDMTRSGDGYVVLEGEAGDVHISAKSMATAQHGDTVRIKTWTPRGRRRPEGEVIKVLTRAQDHFIGVLYSYARFAIVMPDGRAGLEVSVAPADTKGANDKDKVVVKITDWENGPQGRAKGVVTVVLGAAGSHDIEMQSILIKNGFNLAFPDEVIAESETLATEITQAEIARRRDMRGTTTFTIDPDTAKDFDDALSVRFLDDGGCEIGVHIADVAHYVLPDTALDKEAYARSTSVYLVDRVLPMLPEKLSNELCSLRPNEDKLTFSTIFIFNEKGRITDRWIGRTIIHSDRRFAYEEVQEIIDNGDGEYFQELKKLNDLALMLRKERFRQGSINFETDEVKFKLDEAGVPISVYVKERKESHMLVEDFMLLANKEVATYMTKRGEAEKEEIPFVYRIHDLPNMEKVEELARYAAELGFEMKVDTPRDIAKSYNRLTAAAVKDHALKLLEPIAIRTMAKAEYSPDNIGHYGLGFEFYSHFTSPIRRYSDVLAHRILERNLSKGNSYRTGKAYLGEQCKHISKMERSAMEAERESVKYKQVEFIDKHVGQSFDGFISGFSDRGFFVTLDENYCEGMVGFDSISEAVELAGGRLSAKGLRTGTTWRMGSKVRVKIVGTNLERRQIDMALSV